MWLLIFQQHEHGLLKENVRSQFLILLSNNLNSRFEVIGPAFHSPLEQTPWCHKIESRSFTVRDVTLPLLFVVWDNPHGIYYGLGKILCLALFLLVTVSRVSSVAVKTS